MKKAERLNGIIFSIKEKGRLSARQLSEIFEVSERTIYRDIDALSQIKVPIIAYDGLGGGYEIDKDYFLPSIKLSEQEAIILLMILKLGDTIHLPSYKSDYVMLKSKISNTLIGVDQDHIELLLDKVNFKLAQVIPSHYSKGVLSSILEALLKGKQLEFIYYTPAKDAYVKRRVSAKDLHYDAGGWYLTGYCHLRQDKRVFRLDRMSEICVLDLENKQIDDLLTSDNDQFINTRYTLEIEKTLYRLIKENFYFENSQILVDDDPMLLTINTPYERTITELVLQNPLRVTVLSPDVFIDRITQLIKNLNDKYIL